MNQSFYRTQAKEFSKLMNAVTMVLIIYNFVFIAIETHQNMMLRGARAVVLPLVLTARSVFFVQLLLLRHHIILPGTYFDDVRKILAAVGSIQLWFILHTLLEGKEHYGSHIVCLTIVNSFTPLRITHKTVLCVVHWMTLSIGIVVEKLAFPEYVDFAAYEMTRSIVLVGLFVLISSVVAYHRESLACRNHLFNQLSIHHSALLDGKRKRNQKLVHGIVPQTILKQMQTFNDRKVIADRYSEATVLCVQIADFAEYSAALPAARLGEMLAKFFAHIEGIIGDSGIYASNLSSDGTFIIIGGCPTRDPCHAEQIACAAVAILARLDDLGSEFDEYLIPCWCDRMRLRLGMHTGQLVAGIVSTRFSQFKVFGHTIQNAKELASSASCNEIRITPAVHELLKQSDFTFQEAGRVTLSNIGEVATFTCSGGLQLRQPAASPVGRRQSSQREYSKKPSLLSLPSMASTGSEGIARAVSAVFLSNLFQVGTPAENEDAVAAASIRTRLDGRGAAKLSTAQMLLMVFGYSWSAISCTEDEAFQEAAFLSEGYPGEVAKYRFFALLYVIVQLVVLAVYYIPGFPYYGDFFNGDIYEKASNTFNYFVVGGITLAYPFLTTTAFFQRRHQIINLALLIFWVAGRLLVDAAYNALPFYGLLALLIFVIYEYKLIFFHLRVIMATIVAVGYYLVLWFFQVYQFSDRHAEFKLADGHPVRSCFEQEITDKLRDPAAATGDSWIQDYLSDDNCQAGDFTIVLLEKTFEFIEQHAMMTAFHAASHFVMLLMFAWGLAFPTFIHERMNRVAFNTKLRLNLQKQQAAAADRQHSQLLMQLFPTDPAAEVVDLASGSWNKHFDTLVVMCKITNFDEQLQAQDPEGLIMQLHYLSKCFSRFCFEAGVFFLESAQDVSIAFDDRPFHGQTLLRCSHLLSTAHALCGYVEDQELEACVYLGLGECKSFVLYPSSPRFCLTGPAVSHAWQNVSSSVSVRRGVFCSETFRLAYQLELKKSGRSTDEGAYTFLQLSATGAHGEDVEVFEVRQRASAEAKTPAAEEKGVESG